MLQLMDCEEVLSSYLLDTSRAITVHTLCAKAQIDIQKAKKACLQFIGDVKQAQNVVPVTVQIVKPDSIVHDARERIISLTCKDIVDAHQNEIYGLLPSRMENEDSQTHVNNCMYEESQIRNAFFDHVDTETERALEYYHSSNITCSSITKQKTRTTRTSNQSAGPELNIARSSKQSKSLTRATLPKVKPEINKNIFKKITKSAIEPARTSVVKKAPEQQNVLSVDSSSEESDDDIGFKFVPQKTGRKRVVEDEDDDDLEGSETASMAPPDNKKAKVDDDTYHFTGKHVTARVAETDAVPSGNNVTQSVTDKHQKVVTKTRINEDGYMVTEKHYEQIDGEEGENSNKRQHQEKLVSRSQGNAKGKASASASSGGSGKQKTLFSFFKKG